MMVLEVIGGIGLAAAILFGMYLFTLYVAYIEGYRATHDEKSPPPWGWLSGVYRWAEQKGRDSA